MQDTKTDISQFIRIARDTVAGFPAPFRTAAEEVGLQVTDWPSAEMIRAVGLRHPTELTGLYEGVPLTERDDYGGLVMPDLITLYRLPLCEFARDEEELVEEVTVTVVHEIAHHFGIDDDKLHEWGWG